MRRILIADDHGLVRKGISSLVAPWPDMEVVAEASGGREALEQARSAAPDIAILELSLRELNGIELTRAIKSELPAAQVLIYTIFRSDDYARQALEAGAVAYLVKGSDEGELHDALMRCRRSA